MADDEQQEVFHVADTVVDVPSEEADTYGFWDNDTDDVPEHFVRASKIHSSYSDVTLLLGSTYWESGSRVDLCKLRLIMTHSDFLSFVEDMRKHAEFITKLYKGNGPGPDFTKEEFDAAWEELHSDE